MKVIFKTMMLVLAVIIQGCVTYGSLSGVPSVNQKAVFKDGRKTLISVKNNTVAIAPEKDTVKSGKRGSFIIAVNNGTSHDILFSTDGVTALAKINNKLTELKGNLTR